LSLFSGILNSEIYAQDAFAFGGAKPIAGERAFFPVAGERPLCAIAVWYSADLDAASRREK
jgi:hypothetical protein